MIHHFRKESISLAFVYGLTIFFVVLLSAFAVPLTIHRLGIVYPVPEEKSYMRAGYDVRAFENIPIVAQSYIVYDSTSGTVLAERNGYTERPLASITKIMTALTALDIAPPTKRITVTPKSLDGGYDLGLVNKETWTLEELLKYTLVFSSNDGAQLVADMLLGRSGFVEQMNTYAKELGLRMTFTQPAGLDERGLSGGTGSAYDVAKLMTIARSVMPSILDATTHTRTTVRSSRGPISGIPNTNQHITDFIGAEASKTGFTDKAGGNLVISVDPTLGKPVVIVVLGSTREARFSDAFSLYVALLASIR